MTTQTTPQTNSKIKSFHHLTMCVVQSNSQALFTDAVYRTYQNLEKETVENNKGDKDIVRTNYLSINIGKGAQEANTAFGCALPWYQSANMVQSAVADRAEYQQLPTPKYKQTFGLIYSGLDTIKMFSKPSPLARNNPIVKRVAVSEEGLSDTLAAFNLRAEGLTSGKLKTATDIDVLAVPEDSVTSDMKRNMPKNIVTYVQCDSAKETAVSVVKSVNAYFLGMK